MSESGIYIITNTVTGKVYIGQTHRGIDQRLKDHLWALRNNRHKNDKLQLDWSLYGESVFTFEALVLCERDLLDDFERAQIEQHNSCNPECGYNRTKGGSTTFEMTEETKAKIGEAAASRYWSNAEQLHEAIRVSWKDPDKAEVRKQKLSAATKKLWDDPDYRARKVAKIVARCKGKKFRKITDGSSSRMIPADDPLPSGWYYGTPKKE